MPITILNIFILEQIKGKITAKKFRIAFQATEQATNLLIINQSFKLKKEMIKTDHLLKWPNWALLEPFPI